MNIIRHIGNKKKMYMKFHGIYQLNFTYVDGRKTGNELGQCVSGRSTESGQFVMTSLVDRNGYVANTIGN